MRQLLVTDRALEGSSHPSSPATPLPPLAGAYLAWQRASVHRAALPDPLHAQQLAATLAATAAASPAAVSGRGLCSPQPRLHCVLLLPDDERCTQPDLAALADRHLQPALARLAPALHVGSSVALLPPPPPAQQLLWDEGRRAHVLPVTHATAWAQQLERLADGGGLAGEAARVLLYAPPPHLQPLLLERPSGAKSSSMQLSGSSLLLVANPDPSRDSGSGSGSGSEGGLEAELAGRILAWLLQPLAGGSDASHAAASTSPEGTLLQLQRNLTSACAADAAAALHRLAAAASAGPNQPVTEDMSSQAAGVMQVLQDAAQELQRAQSSGAAAAALLAAVVGAWGAAQQLLVDPRTGAQPVFPPEHTLAVLLPLALPVTLVLAQAAGREAGAWKKRRRWLTQHGGEAGAGVAPAEELKDHKAE